MGKWIHAKSAAITKNSQPDARTPDGATLKLFYKDMEPLTIDEKIHTIMSLQSPKWELVQEQYQRMKGDHGLTDAHIAADFGYRSKHAFSNSSAYRRIVTGITRTWLRTK